jgi:hypothetical protein
MICPKCGFEQPDNPECARCGVLVDRYRGPALGADALRPPVSPPPSPTTAGDPPFPMPALAVATGTVYGGPPPQTAPLPSSAFRGTFGVGEILGETFSIYFANFLPFVLLTAIALTPSYVLVYFITNLPKTASPMAIFSAVLLVVLGILAPNIATGAITFGVFQQLRGKDTSIGECLGRGLSLLLPVFGLAICQSFAIAFATLACIVPGVILAVRWAVSIPAAVTEGTGVVASMKRSTFLTDGLGWDVFGVLFVLGAIQIGSTLIAKLAATGNPGLNLLLLGVKDLLVVGLTATGSAVMYYRLRGIKESTDVDQISSVFA